MTFTSNMILGFTDIFNEIKTTVTLRAITITRNATTDDITESNSDASVSAAIMPIEDFYGNEEVGLLEKGRYIAFFASDTSNVDINNNVIHRSATYNIMSVEQAESAGTVIYQVATLEKR